MGKVDISSKQTINIYNQAWAEWILQQQHIKVEAELSGEFQFIARVTDSLLQVKGKEGRFLALTELQLRFDKKMPERLAAYKLLARQKYELPVFVTVVYFLPPSEGVTLATAYEDEFMGQRSQVDFQVVKLWELEAEQVMAFNNPALLPFVPLMHGGDTETMVRKCAERIRQESGAAELEAILAVFAGYVLDVELIKQILRWEMQIVQESPIIQELQQEWLEKGREEGLEKGLEKGREEGLEKGREEGLEKGLEKGREEGKREAALKALRQTLTIRFDVNLGDFDKRFESLDLEKLEQLNEVALTAQTLAEFENALAEMVSKVDTTSPHSDNGQGQEE